MKNFIFSLLLLSNLSSYSQRDTITSDVKWPAGLAISGNFLFIAESDSNRISKLDVTLPNPTPVVYVTDLERPNFMELNGNELYFTEHNGGKISKIDITLSNPIPITVISGLNLPKDLLINGTDLYYTEPSIIFKIDLTLTTPTPSIVISGLSGPIGLALNGNELYFSEYAGNKISKIDITLPNPTPSIVLDGLIGPLNGMAINGTELYFSEYGNSTISKIDISLATPSIINFDTDVSAGDLLFAGSDLYVSDFLNDLILKYENIVTSINSYFSSGEILIYPNPAHNSLFFNGLTGNVHCVIVNSLGIKVKDIIVSDGKQTDVGHLATGVYFILFDNGLSKKFIKS